MCGLSLLIPLFIKPLYFSHYTSTYSGQQQQALWPSVIFYCIQQAKQEHVNIKLEECFFQPSSICIRKKVKGPECNKYKMAFCWTKRQIMWFAWEVEHYSTRRPERSLITNIRKRLTARFMLHLKIEFWKKNWNSLQFSGFKAIKWLTWVHLRGMTGSLSHSYHVLQGPAQRHKESRMDRFGERQTILHHLLPSHWIMWHGRQPAWFERE